MVREQLEGFGVSQIAIKRAISLKILLTANDIVVDDVHPPAEALGYSLTHIKQVINIKIYKASN